MNVDNRVHVHDAPRHLVGFNSLKVSPEELGPERELNKFATLYLVFVICSAPQISLKPWRTEHCTHSRPCGVGSVTVSSSGYTCTGKFGNQSLFKPVALSPQNSV